MVPCTGRHHGTESLEEARTRRRDSRADEAPPTTGWSHHTIHDHIVEVDGERATLDAQFVVFNNGASGAGRGARRATTGEGPGRQAA